MKKIIALGYFDCIHIGHRYLLQEGAKKAQQKGAKLILSTFNDDFLTLIGRKSEEIFLLEERKEIIDEIGIHSVIVFPSEKEFFLKTKEEFCEYIEELNPTGLIAGDDYRFGKNAEGSVEFLSKYFEGKCDVFICDLLAENGEKISTNLIKNLLKKGEIGLANQWLGRSFFYEGIVSSGRHDGRKIGIPTLNLPIAPTKIKIRSGVYITNTLIDGKKYLSVTNVGEHPTYGDLSFNVETHVIDNYLGNIYEKKIRIEFIDFIRDIIVFKDPKKLAEQIQNDIMFAIRRTND